jgi:prepilin-type N-terminal cleavage/methylation domain-containing protein
MRQRGFTLVELSIVLIILALVGGVFMAMFIGLYDGQRVTVAVAASSSIIRPLLPFADGSSSGSNGRVTGR